MRVSVRTTRSIGLSLRFRSDRRSGNLAQSSAYHLQNGQEYNTCNETGENGLRGVEHVSMPDDSHVNGREYEQAFRGCVQARNPTFEPVTSR